MQDGIDVQGGVSPEELTLRRELQEAMQDTAGWSPDEGGWRLQVGERGCVTCRCEGTHVVMTYDDGDGTPTTAKGLDLAQARDEFQTALADRFNLASVHALAAGASAAPALR